MIHSPRLAALAVVSGLLLAACGQKGPLFLPKDEVRPTVAKGQQKPKAKPQPSPTPEPEAPSPDADDVQDGYSPMSDQPDF